MRRFLTTTALALSAGLGLINVNTPAAKADYYPMLLEQPRFQPNFGSGYYPNSSSYRYRSSYRPSLIEQPRFQPSFGSGGGYYGGSYRSYSSGW